MAAAAKPQEVSEADKQGFADLTAKPYAEQAKWFLNAFWSNLFENNEKELEDVWARTQTCAKLDQKMKDKGTELDEFQAHKFLEEHGETLTVIDLRNRLRTIDLDMNGKMSLSEYFLFKYDKKVHELVRPQADPVEVKKAAEKVAVAQAQFDEAAAKQAELNKTLEDLKQAQAENKAAQDDVKRQEDEFKAKIDDCEARSQQGGVVQRNKAVAELAQLKADDPMPLRRAKLTLEAAGRKVDKAKKKAEEAKEAADAAAAEAETAFNDAKAYLEDVKSRVGSSEGTFWWMEREMTEMAKYRPGAKKAKPPPGVQG